MARKAGRPSTASGSAQANASASTELADRDCTVVAYGPGMTFSFADSAGLRSFEVLITGVTGTPSVNWPDVVYRGDPSALVLEEGDNHLAFAEYETGGFFVTRALANTITIGG